MTSHDCRHAPEESPPSPAKPAHNSIYLAAASIDITPQNPLPLAGYRRRPDRFSRVRDPLEVNGVLLRQGDRVAVILSADLLYVTDHLKDLVLGRLSREFSGAPFSVIFGASHTHSAPAVDDTKPVLGTANRNYVEFVAVQVMKLIDALAAKQAKAATIAYHHGKVAHAINRRRRGWKVGQGRIKKTMTFLPNPDGHKDDSVHLVSFQNAAGIHLCTLWSYACHPTSCPERNAVSADFPGVVRRGVRKVTGQDSLPILFLQGFAGNLRPTAYDRTLRPISVLLRLLNGQIFGLFSDAEYEAWSSSLADHVVRILQAEGNGLTGSLGWASVEIPLSRIFEGSAEDQTIRLQRLALSENLSLIGVSAEVVAEYGDHVRALFGPATTIPVGHLDSVFGYLPTRQIVAEGGYEAGDFCPSFGLSGRFKPECEAIIVRGLRELKDLLI